MKVQLFIVFVFAFLAIFATADDLQDEIDAARKKFCGGKVLELFLFLYVA